MSNSTGTTPANATSAPATSRVPRAMSSRGNAIRGHYESLAHKIRTSLSQVVPAGSAVVVGITSCGRGEGVSTVAANLAASSVAIFDKPVLLIDANPTKPVLDRTFGLAPAFPGLWEYLHDEAPLESCIRGTRVPGLSILPAGRVGQAHERMLLRPKADEMFEAIRKIFDFVVVDLPPVSTLDASLMLAERSDGVVLVVESEKVRLPAAQHARQQLAGTDVRVLGVVLNKRKYHIPEWLYRRL